MKAHQLPVLGLLLFSFPLFFLGLSDTGLKGTDELRYSKIARELGPGRDLFLLHFNGHRYTDKPPMYFWMVAGSHKLLGGISPLAGRLPGVLSGLMSGLLCYFLAFYLLKDRRLALFSAATLIMMPRFIWIARWIRLDIPMAMFSYAAMLCFVVNYFGEKRRLTGWFFWLFLALSFSIKGPAGPAVVLGGILAFLVLQKEGRRVKELFHPGGVLLFIGLTLAWVLPILLLGESEASKDLIVGQNIGRIVSPDRHVEAPWYYAENIWYNAFPAMLLMAAFCLYAWRSRKAQDPDVPESESLWARHRASRRFLICWAVFTLIMFSIYPPKRPQYLIPGFPAFAMLAVHLLSVLDQRVRTAGGDALKRVRRTYAIPLWISFVPIALLSLILLWKDVLYPAVYSLTEKIDESAAFDLQQNYADFEYGGFQIGWILRVAGTLAVFGASAYFYTCLKRKRPMDAFGGLLAATWFFFLLFFGCVIPASFGDEDLIRYATELQQRLNERPELMISVFGEDKPYYNVYGDFHIEYFDDDFDDEFRAYSKELYEEGHPMLVIVEADEEKEVRRTPWYDSMTRRKATIQGDEIVILESPEPAPEPAPTR